MSPTPRLHRPAGETPGSQLALFATYSYHSFITDRDGEMLERLIIAATPRGMRYATSQRRLAGGTGDGPNLARWTARMSRWRQT